MTRLRIALINDYDIVVEGLAAMLEPFSDRVEIVDLAAGDPPSGPADIALFDTFGGRRTSLERVEAMADDPSLGRVVLYTWDLPDAFVSDIGDRAVDAVILKSSSGEALVEALERIHRGESVPPAEHVDLVDLPTLSEREREVLALLGCGLSNRAIAQELYLSVDTVKTHVRKVFVKLGVFNRTQAALIANEHRLVVRTRRSVSAN